MYKLFIQGGVVMWPLLGLSILASALSLYHFYLVVYVKKQAGESQDLLFEKIQRGIDNIFLIGSLAPLLGLLGTVLGIIDCFSTLSMGRPDHHILSQGLSQALLTTAAGLILSIPCQIVGHVLQQRLDKAMLEVKKSCEG